MATALGNRLTAFLGERYYPALDGVRAISVLLVMSNHLHSGNAILRRAPGWTGVDFFCVLSGFLITTLLLREERESGSVRLGDFYIRRFFRIVPIFLLAFVLLRTLRSRALLAGGFLVMSAGLYLGMERVSDRAFFDARSYAALALGALLACLLASKFASAYSRQIGRIPSVLPSVAVAVTLGLVFYGHKNVLLLDVCIAAFLSHLLLVPSLIRACLASPALVWVGRRSYSMYLIHLLVMNPMRVVLHPVTIAGELCLLLVAYCVTAAGAHILYLFVEEPMRLVGKRVIAKRLRNSKQPAASCSTPRISQ